MSHPQYSRFVPRPTLRMTGALKPGAAFDTSDMLSEKHFISGARKVTVRIKTATEGGSVDIVLAYQDSNGTITEYTTGNPQAVSVTAGTEALITTELSGENIAIVKFTASGDSGTVEYCDISQLPAGL